ncbi:MAG TPA: hypothetical protein VFE72_04145 [Lysobacter sp.]|nr:hypothetical protein [Lysobacter sp.]
MPRDRRPPWKSPPPPSRGAGGTLTEAQKQAAAQRAQEAGRRYPNLVDNMWALRQPRGDQS